MDINFDYEFKGLGFQTKGYPGAFTPIVEHDIKKALIQIRRDKGKPIKVLHLFSGVSAIGDIRVDIERQEATDRVDVMAFIEQDQRWWDAVLLDPPYSIQNTRKLLLGEYVSDTVGGYGRVSSVASDVPMRNALSNFFIKKTNNVLWLDMCVPFPTVMKQAGYKRQKLYFYFPGGYHTMRVMSWLRRK